MSSSSTSQNKKKICVLLEDDSDSDDGNDEHQHHRKTTTTTHNNNNNNQGTKHKSSLQLPPPQSKNDVTNILPINTKYAKSYEMKKQREELQKHQHLLRRWKGNPNDHDGSSSSSSSENDDDDEDDEDDEAVLLTTKLDIDIMKTIHAIRTKDPKIYNPNIQFFSTHTETNDNNDDSDDDDENEHTTLKPNKVKRYKDVIREQVLELMDQEEHNMEDDDDENNNDPTTTTLRHQQRLVYDAQQEQVRQDFLASVRDQEKNNKNTDNKKNDENDDDDDDDILVMKSNSRTSARKNDNNDDDDDDNSETLEQFRQEIAKLQQTQPDTSKIHTNTNTNQHNHNSMGKITNDAFVDPRGEVTNGYEYILNFFQQRPWKAMKQKSLQDNDDDDNNDGDDMDEDVDDLSSVDDVEKADEFEAKYNFRFEDPMNATTNNINATNDLNEDDSHNANDDNDNDDDIEIDMKQSAPLPDAYTPITASGAELSNIPYARSQMMETLRRKDDRRTKKRQERLERKAAERQAKEEQLKRLKNIKRQELQNKLQQIKMVLGQQQQKQQQKESKDVLDEDAIMKLLEGDYDPEQYEQMMEQMYNDDYYEGEETEWKTDTDVRDAFIKQAVLDEEKEVVGPDDMDGGLYDNIKEYEDEPYDENDEEWNGDDEEGQYYGDDYEGEPETDIERKVKAKMEEELYKLDYEDIVAGMPTRFKYRNVPKNNYGLSTMEILCARDTTLKQYVSLKKLAPYNEEEYVVHSNKRRKFRSLIQKEIIEEDPHTIETAKDKEPESIPKDKNETTSNGKTTDKSDQIDNSKNDEEANPAKSKKRRRRLKKKNGTPSDDNEALDHDDVSDQIDLKVDISTTEPNNTTEMDALKSNDVMDSEEKTNESLDVKSKKRRRRKKKSEVSGTDIQVDTDLPVPNGKVLLENHDEAKNKQTVNNEKHTIEKESTIATTATSKATTTSKQVSRDISKKSSKKDNQRLHSKKDDTKKKRKPSTNTTIDGVSGSRLAAYGL